jgi:2-oxoglutarate ferredoxin oxidoreductase subunit delta
MAQRMKQEGKPMAEHDSRKLLIDRKRCKGCGICVQFCPKKVLVLDAEDKAMLMDSEHCIACGMCELWCPDLAIALVAARQGDQTEEAVS